MSRVIIFYASFSTKFITCDGTRRIHKQFFKLVLGNSSNCFCNKGDCLDWFSWTEAHRLITFSESATKCILLSALANSTKSVFFFLGSLRSQEVLSWDWEICWCRFQTKWSCETSPRGCLTILRTKERIRLDSNECLTSNIIWKFEYSFEALQLFLFFFQIFKAPSHSGKKKHRTGNV